MMKELNSKQFASLLREEKQVDDVEPWANAMADALEMIFHDEEVSNQLKELIAFNGEDNLVPARIEDIESLARSVVDSALQKFATGSVERQNFERIMRNVLRELV